MSTKQLHGNTKKHIVRRYPARTYRRKMKYHIDEPEIRLRRIDKADARKKIQHYINKNPGCLTSEIIEGLLIEPGLAMQTLEELKRDDLVLSKDIE
jgi:predicted transcriptional regulator